MAQLVTINVAQLVTIKIAKRGPVSNFTAYIYISLSLSPLFFFLSMASLAYLAERQLRFWGLGSGDSCIGWLWS